MAVQAFLIMTAAQNDDVLALFDANADGNVVPRVIDNPLANQLGQGDIDNDHFAAPARLLNDPDYTRYTTLCSAFPIYTWDSDVLFAPPPPEEEYPEE